MGKGGEGAARAKGGPLCRVGGKEYLYECARRSDCTDRRSEERCAEQTSPQTKALKVV